MTSPTVSTASAVETANLTKTYKTGDGVKDLNLTIAPGSIFGFVGPSGSGKTTTIRLLTGVVAPTAGSAKVLGVDPLDFTAAERSRLGYLPQLSVLIPNLTVTQNLRFFNALQGASGGSARRRRAEVLEFVELTGDGSKRVDQISGGMQRRLSLACALAHDPEVIFLDEPTAGIDPVLRRSVWDRFGELKDQGRTLFVTTQYVGEAAYCDYVGVLSDGELLAVDTPRGLRYAALGGEVLDIEVAQPPTETTMRALADVLEASKREMVTPTRIRLTVEDAGKAIPTATSWAESHQLGLVEAEEYTPPFDDVFVSLIEDHRRRQETDARPEAEGHRDA